MTHPSYSNENEGPLTNYQRLEFLGDSVLEFIISLKLYILFSSSSEGRLSYIKTRFVNNEFLSKLAESIDIQKYIIIKDFDFKLSQNTKIQADVLESIIGAIYLEFGLEKVDNSWLDFLFPHIGPTKSLWENILASSTSEEEEKLDVDIILETPLKFTSEIENKIGIIFQDKKLLLTAFIHPSYYKKFNNIKGPNYQRLEFLGDSILELIVTEYLYIAYPSATEGDLSLCRSRLVNNDILMEKMRERELDQYLFHYSPYFTFEGPKLRKAIADLFESLLAAIYLDKGWLICKNFALELLSPSTLGFSKHGIKSLDPKSFFQVTINNRV